MASKKIGSKTKALWQDPAFRQKMSEARKNGKKVENYHGMSQTAFYKKWTSMTSRCNNPNTDGYVNYGGRGIKIEWKSFKEFKDDMYESYLKHVEEFGQKQTTIDRINNDGNYRKDNCRWATYSEQITNSRHSLRKKCMRGHLLNEENLIQFKKPGQRLQRWCKTCKQARDKKYYYQDKLSTLEGK